MRLKDARLIRLSIQRLAANNIWSEKDVLFPGSRQVHWEKIAECLCTDEEANMFVEKLCVVTGLYWQEPDKLAPAEVRSNRSNLVFASGWSTDPPSTSLAPAKIFPFPAVFVVSATAPESCD